MKTYMVIVKEVHDSHMLIDAENEEDALINVENGEG